MNIYINIIMKHLYSARLYIVCFINNIEFGLSKLVLGAKSKNDWRAAEESLVLVGVPIRL